MIHEFKNGHWLPGDARRDGSKPFPKQPRQGWHFNDVTGAEGATVDAVVQPLAELLMQRAPIASLLPRPVDWAGFMARLQAAETPATESEREFGRVWLKPDETLEVSPGGPWDRHVVEEAASLALALVRANGQLDYIRRQAWFKTGTHRVVLALDREFQRTTPSLLFHLDTTGSTLFSNLMFLNSAGLPAPEWSPNLEPMLPERRALVGRHWPAELLAAVDDQRQRLAASAAPLRIEGGTLPENACVSWIDELVWHSTPWLEPRDRYTLEEVRDVLADDGFGPVTFDVLSQVVQTPGSRLAALLTAAGMPPSSLNNHNAATLWTALHHDPSARPRWDALRQDVESIDWSRRTFDTATGFTQGLHPQDGAPAPMVQPTGMVGRPRSNSENLATLKADVKAWQVRRFIQVVVNVEPAH